MVFDVRYSVYSLEFSVENIKVSCATLQLHPLLQKKQTQNLLRLPFALPRVRLSGSLAKNVLTLWHLWDKSK